MKKHFYDFFIPHQGNGYLPKNLHLKSLFRYSYLIFLFKAFVVLSLFFIFPTVAEFSTITQNRIVELVNIERKARGLNELKISPVLERAAKMKLQDMFDKNYFDHKDPNGTPPWVWFKKAGYIYTYAGENLAINFIEAEEVHKAWMASKTHRENMLNPNYKEIGVAVGVGKINGANSTLIVQFFGTTFTPPQFSNILTLDNQNQTKKEVKSEVDKKSDSKTEKNKQVAEKTDSKKQYSTTEKTALENKTSKDDLKNKETEKKSSFAIPNTAKESELDVEKYTRPIEDLPVAYNNPTADDIEDVVYDKGNMTKVDREESKEKRILVGSTQSVTIQESGPLGVFGKFIRWMKEFYIFIIGFLFLSLLIKILIKAHIQHHHIIIIVLFIIIGTAMLVMYQMHFLESVGRLVIL